LLAPNAPKITGLRRREREKRVMRGDDGSGWRREKDPPEASPSSFSLSFVVFSHGRNLREVDSVST